MNPNKVNDYSRMVFREGYIKDMIYGCGVICISEYCFFFGEKRKQHRGNKFQWLYEFLPIFFYFIFPSRMPLRVLLVLWLLYIMLILLYLRILFYYLSKLIMDWIIMTLKDNLRALLICIIIIFFFSSTSSLPLLHIFKSLSFSSIIHSLSSLSIASSRYFHRGSKLSNIIIAEGFFSHQDI